MPFIYALSNMYWTAKVFDRYCARQQKYKQKDTPNKTKQ